jgi:hypothetical protein
VFLPRLLDLIYLEADGLSRNPGRDELEEYSRGLAMVEIRPLEEGFFRLTDMGSRRVKHVPVVCGHSFIPNPPMIFE